MPARRLMGLIVAAIALVGSQLLMGSATAAPGPDYAAQARAAGLTPTQVTQLQTKVATYQATHPDARRLDANTLTMPGGTVSFTVPGSTPHGSLMISCTSGHLCIQDGWGGHYDYYYCGYYSFTGGGDGVFNNNQTSGTVAKFYNSDGSLRWTDTAKDTGTASWTPVYYIRPC